MAAIFPQSSDGQTISIPAGVHIGHVALTQKNCIFAGAGIGKSTIKTDGSYGEMFRATLAGPCSYTLKNVTLDAGDLLGLVCVISADPGQEVYLKNVHITGHSGSMAIFNRHRLFIQNCLITGNSGAVYHYTGATDTYIDGLEVRGGKYALLANGPGRIHVNRLVGKFNYWSIPTYEEVVATGFGETHVDVASHVEANRSLYDCIRALTPIGALILGERLYCPKARKYDRVQTSSGHWTEVLGVSDGVLALDDWHLPDSWIPCPSPSGEATVYRVALGRLYSASPTRLGFTTSGATGYWRNVTGGKAKVPTPDSLVHVIRNGLGGGPRDVDSGGIHLTDTSSPGIFTDCSITGTFADCITPRVSGSRFYNCKAILGQDMGFTLDGNHHLSGCISDGNGYDGYYLVNGPSNLYNCIARNNGTQDDGSGGYGVVVADSDSQDSAIHVKFDGNKYEVGGVKTTSDGYPVEY